jgi:hypothetical protein
MEMILSRIAAVLIYAALHGAALALLAKILGDRRPEREGRLPPNPFTQISVWGVAIGALFAMSWVRPLHFNVSAIRLRIWGIVLVVVAASFFLMLLVPFLDLLRGFALLLPASGSYAVLLVLAQVQLIAAGSAILNLLPIPGLAMGAIYPALWPGREKRVLRYEPIGLAFVIAVLAAGLVPTFGAFLLPHLSLL